MPSATAPPARVSTRPPAALLLGWFLFVYGFFALLTLDREDGGRILSVGEWLGTMAVTATGCVPLAILAWRFVYLPRPGRFGRARWWTLHLAGLAACGALNYAVELAAAVALELEMDLWHEVFLGTVLLYSFVALAVAVLAQLRRSREHQRTRERLRSELLHAELERTRAELRALQLELNPRFLFHALDTVAERAGDDLEEASRALLLLSGLLRRVLENAEAREVPLGDEMAGLELFLDLERIRRRGALVAEASVEGPVEEARVPHLLLLTLTDALLRRGPEEPVLEIRVAVRASERGVEATLRAWGGAGAVETPGAELRLRRLYGDDFELRNEPADGGRCISVALPLRAPDPATLPVAAPAADGALRAVHDPPVRVPEPTRRMKRLGWAAYAVLWGVMTASGAAVWLRGDAGVPPALTLLLAGWVGLVRAAYFAAPFLLVRVAPIERARWPRGAALYLGVGAGLSALAIVSRDLVRDFHGFRPDTTIPPLDQVLSWFLVFGMLLGVAQAGRSRALNRARREAERRLSLAVAETQLQWTRAELRALKMKLNPHFLFNALNAVSALLYIDSGEARRVVRDLGTLLRRVLERAGAYEVPLRDEIELAELYLQIEQTRFGDRLALVWEVEPAALAARVPHLLLQPLVENAVKHGVSPRAAPGTVRVFATREGDRVRLGVADDGPGPAASAATRGTGIGLRNIRQRLASLYGDDFGFELRAAPEGGAVAEVDIPFRPADPEPAAAPPAPAPAFETVAG